MSAQLTPPGGNSRVLAQTEGTRWNPANALVEGTEPRVWGSQGHQNPEDRVAEMSELPGETVAGRPLPECPAGHRAHSIEMLTDHRALSNTQVYSVPILLSPRLNRALNLHDILKKKKKNKTQKDQTISKQPNCITK